MQIQSSTADAEKVPLHLLPYLSPLQIYIYEIAVMLQLEMCHLAKTAHSLLSRTKTTVVTTFPLSFQNATLFSFSLHARSRFIANFIELIDTLPRSRFFFFIVVIINSPDLSGEQTVVRKNCVSAGISQAHGWMSALKNNNNN